MTLNLVYPEQSSIKYNKVSYPDGQQDIEITSTLNGVTVIVSRLNSFKDLELILCATAAVRNLGGLSALRIPYILGARCDRQFKQGGTSYLRDVIAPILNAQNYEYIKCTDPHSDVAEAVIKRLIPKDNFPIVNFALNHFGNRQDLNLICPDAGAYKKIVKVADRFKINNVFVCSKIRKDGKIVKTSVPEINNDLETVIVDDICDGGRTFIEIAKELKKQKLGKLYLVVTHGIFSKGYEELSEYFNTIFCSNSYKDITSHHVNHLDKLVPTNVKQLNIF